MWHVFSSFIAKSCLNDLDDISLGQRAQPLMVVIICAKHGKNPSVDITDWTRHAGRTYFSSFMPEWPWRYRSRSKVIVHNTTSHGSDQLYLIWKESIQNCTRYRADTACGTEGRTDGMKPIYPPTDTHRQLHCGGGIMKMHSSCYHNKFCIQKDNILKNLSQRDQHINNSQSIL